MKETKANKIQTVSRLWFIKYNDENTTSTVFVSINNISIKSIILVLFYTSKN